MNTNFHPSRHTQENRFDIPPVFGGIINMRSGLHPTRSQEALTFFHSHFSNPTFFQATRSAEEMRKFLAYLMHNGINILFVMGGDGTYQKVISELFQSCSSLPVLVPLKGGTMNMVVKDFKLNRLYTDVAKKIQYQANKKKLRISPKRILKVTFGPSSNKNIKSARGFCFANGLIYSLALDYENKRRPADFIFFLLKNLIATLISSPHAKHVFDTKIPLAIEYSHKINDTMNIVRQDGLFSAIIISSLHRLLFGAHPFFPLGRNARKDAHTFHCLLFNIPMKKLMFHLLPMMYAQIFNRKQTGSKSIFETSDISLTTRHGFMLDGELYPLHKQHYIHVSAKESIVIPHNIYKR